MTSTQGLTSEQISMIRDYLKVANDEQLQAIIPMVKTEINDRYDRRAAEIDHVCNETCERICEDMYGDDI